MTKTACPVGLVEHRKGRRTFDEQETVVRFDRAGVTARLYTADRAQANRWLRRGYPIRATSGGWETDVPKRLITFRTQK